MASTSETGHKVNVNNFKKLIAYCISYLTNYNPSRSDLAVAALQTLHTNSRNAVKAVNTAVAPWKVAVNNRQIAFRPLSKLATRIINALDATSASDELIADVRGLVRKITGERKEKIINPDDEKSISASQQSYTQRLSNFRKLVSLLADEPFYVPNELALQLATLNTLITTLNYSNQSVMDATAQLGKARIARNKVLYKAHTGLVDIAMEVKKYVKSLYGATSEEYKEVSGLKFTRII